MHFISDDGKISKGKISPRFQYSSVEQRAKQVQTRVHRQPTESDKCQTIRILFILMIRCLCSPSFEWALSGAWFYQIEYSISPAITTRFSLLTASQSIENRTKVAIDFERRFSPRKTTLKQRKIDVNLKWIWLVEQAKNDDKRVCVSVCREINLFSLFSFARENSLKWCRKYIFQRLFLTNRQWIKHCK